MPSLVRGIIFMPFSFWFRQQGFQSPLPSRCLNTILSAKWKRVSFYSSVSCITWSVWALFLGFSCTLLRLGCLIFQGEMKTWFEWCVVFLGRLLFFHLCLFYEAFSRALITWSHTPWVRLWSRLSVSFGCYWQLSSLWGLGQVITWQPLFNRLLPLSSVCWLVMGCFSSIFGRKVSSRVFLVSRLFILISIQLQLLLRHLRKPSPSLSLGQRFSFSSWLTNGPLSVLWRSLQAIVIVSFRFSMLTCLQTQVRLLWFWLPLLFLLLGLEFHS